MKMDKKLLNALNDARQPQDPKNGWYVVTSNLAKMLLKYNDKNYRAKVNSTIKRYALDMLYGNWKKNGETIVFNTKGRLQNGQHRLEGVVAAKVPVVMYLIFDAEETTLYDYNKGRSLLDMQRFYGTSANSLYNATAKIIINGTTKTEPVGVVYHYNYVKKNEKLLKLATSIVSTNCGKKNKVGKKAACSAIVYAMLVNKEMSEHEMRNFFSVVNSGNAEDCPQNASSALQLREQLEEMHGGGGYIQQKQVEITYKALRDFRFQNNRTEKYNNDTDDAIRFIKIAQQKTMRGVNDVLDEEFEDAA